MTMLHRLAAGTALTLTLAGPAAALTPEEVWADFQALAEDYGLTVATEGESADGGTLTVTGIALTAEGEEGTSVAFSIPSMTFAGQDGGAVAVTLAPEVGIDVASPAGDDPEDDPAGSLDMTLDTSAFTLTASGEGEARSYEYAAPTIGLRADEAMRGDEAIPLDLLVTMANLAGTQTSAPGEADGLRRVESRQTADSLIAEISVSDVPSDENGVTTANIAFTINGITSEGTSTIPAEVDYNDLSAAVRAGYGTDGSVAYDGLTFAIDSDGPEGATAVAGTNAGGQIAVTIGEDGLGYTTAGTEGTLTISADQLPVGPVEVATSRTESEVRLPIAAAEAAQPYTLRLLVEGLTMSDQIWARFDPEAVLPRDPIDLDLDLSGEMVLTQDLLTPEGMGEDDEDAPAELESVDLDLRLKAVGAEITAAGDIAIDNDDTETYPGMPAPVGTIEIVASGIDALLEDLVEIGVLPEDQLSGTRLMLGLFARTDESGGYTSTIEFGEGGAVTANGQRLR